jgi:hypothetical protein
MSNNGRCYFLVDGPQSDDLLRPVFMGCATRNAKVVAISLGSLQRLIALKAVPHSAVSRIISTMGDAMSQGVDIQLRILQTLVSLITNFPAIHGNLLGDVRIRLVSIGLSDPFPGPPIMFQTPRIKDCRSVINRSSHPSPARNVRRG